MGQENEEKAELIATIKHDHVKMKQWYNNAPEAISTLHSRYGSSYPSFWKEVISWNGWRESRKLFLKSMELKEKKERERRQQLAANNNNNANNAGVNGASAGSNATADSANGGKSAPRRKRRSRWGNNTNTNTSSNTNESQPTKRRSRWGDSNNRGRDETPKPNTTNSISTTSTSSILDILPGLPTNLNSQQSVKLKELQSLLREANKRLENLEVEAARVDALPKGHVDRSPSPPPGEFLFLKLFFGNSF